MVSGARVGGLWYWGLVAALLVVGVVGIFSIGLPLLLTGLVLAALAPMRRDPAAFWPPLAGTVAFFLGYILIAPLGCTSTPGEATPMEVGIDYSGSGSYDPPLLPALLAGMLIGAAASLATRALLGRRVPGSPAS